MDPTASILIVTPILMPIITEVGIDPVHFGIIMILNLMIGLLTPPVGMSLYTVANIGNIKIENLIRELLPFYFLFFVIIGGIDNLSPNNTILCSKPSNG